MIRIICMESAVNKYLNELFVLVVGVASIIGDSVANLIRNEPISDPVSLITTFCMAAATCYLVLRLTNIDLTE